jgi:hypothetical protein
VTTDRELVSFGHAGLLGAARSGRDPGQRRSRITAAVVVLGLGVATIVVSAIFASPALADRSAKDVIDSLEKNGYRVRQTKVGTGPLERCVVTGQHPGEPITQVINGEKVLKYNVMIVYIDCTIQRKRRQ